MSFSAIALFSFLAAFGYLPEPLPPFQGQNEPVGEQQPSDDEPDVSGFPVVVENPLTVIEQPTTEQKQAQADQAWREQALLVIAGGAALFAFLAFIANHRQAKAAELQSNIMKQQFLEAHNEANEQRRFVIQTAMSLQRQADVAERNMILTTRSYINPETWRHKFLTPTRLLITAKLRNVGRIPATVELIEAHVPNRPRTTETLNVMVFPEKGRTRVVTTIELDKLKPHAAETFSFMVTVTGRVRYSDEFGLRDRYFHRYFAWNPSKKKGRFLLPDTHLNNEAEGTEGELDEAWAAFFERAIETTPPGDLANGTVEVFETPPPPKENSD